MDLIERVKQTGLWVILPQLTVAEMQQIMKAAADSYYNTDAPIITDSEYDALAELVATKTGKNAAIGAPIRGTRVRLPYWMGSMNKVKMDDRQLVKWLDKYAPPYLLSDKLDGVSCLMTKHSNCVKIYTRGNGNYGRDITHLLDIIDSKWQRLLQVDVPDIAIRGELIIKKSAFQDYREIISDPRAAVTGVVVAKKDSVNRDYAGIIDFVTYEIIAPVMVASQQFKCLRKWGMHVVHHQQVKCIDFASLDEIWQQRRAASPYEIDGIIVADSKIPARNVSGNPDYAFAYKGATETANVTVQQVIWSPSKDGILVPRIKYDKTRLSQADLKAATAYNAKFIRDNKIGPGAMITIIRSGSIIPKILAVTKTAQPALPQDHAYYWDANGVNIILDNIATNSDVIIKRMHKFVRDIGVAHLSMGLVTRLVESGYDTIFKIIQIRVDDMLEISGFKTRLATKIHDNMQASLQQLDLVHLMVASNIMGRGMGASRVQTVLQQYPDIVAQYRKSQRDTWQTRLQQLDGFDRITTTKFLDNLPEFIKFYKKFIKISPIVAYIAPQITGHGLADMRIAFTGVRKPNWHTQIQAQGGQVTSTVTKNTSILVHANNTSNAKYQQAIKLGIRTMSVAEFAKTFNMQ